MIRALSALVMLPLLLGMSHAPRSGLLGVFALIDKVVLEPNDSTPERIQIWGAFSYVDGGVEVGKAVTVARKGYMYFSLSDGPITPASAPGVERIRREWADLKAVAGTGEAVGFGMWGYSGDFSTIEPLQPFQLRGPFVVARIDTTTGRMVPADQPRPISLRTRLASEPIQAPIGYRTNVGVVKLPAWSHADVIRRLREAK